MKSVLFLLPMAEGETGFWENLPRDSTAYAGGTDLVVVVPAVDVLFLEARLPPGGHFNLKQGIPYLLEENLLPPVEELHFARGSRRSDGTIPVAVVAKQRLASWLARLAAAGVRPRALVCDSQLLPVTAGSWTVLAGPRQSLVRPDQAPPFAVDSTNLLPLLTLAAQSSPLALHIFDHHSGLTWSHLSWPAPVTVTPVADPWSLLDTGEIDKSINLLQGDFGKRERGVSLWRQLRPTVTLLLLLAIVLMGADLLRHDQLQRSHDRYEQSIHDLFLELFPGGKPVKPRLQMEQKLRERENQDRGEKFLPLLREMGQKLADLPDITLEKLQFQNQQMVVHVRASTLQLLERFQQGLLETTGRRAVLQNIVHDQGGVTALLQVER